MQYSIHPDGSFDLFEGKNALKNAYPSVDGTPIRPVKVETIENGICYTLIDGVLKVSFAVEEGVLALGVSADGLEKAHDVMPVADAVIEGGDRAFIQGFGIGGPSGFRKLDGKEYESHSLIAVGSDACLALYTRKQDRFHFHGGIKGNKLRMGFDTECVRRPSPELPTIYLRFGESFDEALHAAAGEIAGEMHARPVTRPAFHWCSWYYLYHTLDQATLEEYMEGFKTHKDVAPFTHIQIDAGYFPSCGDWLDDWHTFPKGLKAAADTIKAAGYEPGIWIGPFMVGDNSRLFHEHPDWMLKNRDGSYVRPWIQYNEPKPWGYRDSDYFVLDTSHPDAMEYLRTVFKTLREYGYTLFKTDFLLWGLQDSASVLRYTPGKTSFEYFRDVMGMIREAIGEDARWLGCIAPFMPSIGFVDMMRIGGDVGAQWEEGGFGPQNMLQELTADQYFNNVYWQNDPDAVMLRDFHIHLKKEQIEGLALLEAMSGGAIYTSDPLHLIGKDRLDLLDFIRPNGIHNPEYPFWSDMRDEAVLIQRLETRSMIYFFNRTDKVITESYDWKKLLGENVRYLRARGGESEKIEDVPFIRIPARSGVLYYATAEPMEKEPENLWAE